MDITGFLTDEDAASSVIGVVLMVAVAVILAAVIGQFVLGISDKVNEKAPDTNFDYTGGACGGVKVTHADGAEIDGRNLKFGGAAEEYRSFDSIEGWNNSTVSAGDSVVVNATPGEELTLVWKDDSNGTTAVISTYDVPKSLEYVGTASLSGLSASGGPDTATATVSYTGVDSVYMVGIIRGPEVGGAGKINSPGTYTFDYSTDGGQTGDFNFDLEPPKGDTITTSKTYGFRIYRTSDKECLLAEQLDTA